MAYIMDASSIKYLLDEFPRNLIPNIWKKFESLCILDEVISDREVKKELEFELNNTQSLDWIDKNKGIFKPLLQSESIVLGEMVKDNVFSYYENSVRLVQRKLPEGIPFIIAKAKCNDDTVVYRKNSRNANTILTICEEKHIEHLEVEEFLLNINK